MIPVRTTLLGAWRSFRRDPGRAALVIGEAVNRGSRFVLLLLLARLLGAEAFGPWVIAIATATILANAADVGLIMSATTQIAADRSRTRKLIANIWAAVPLLGLAAVAVLAGLAPLLGKGTSLFLLFVVGLGGIFENGATLLLSPLRAHERFQPEGLLRAAQGSAIMIVGSSTLAVTGNEAAVAFVFLGVGAGSTALAAAASIRAFGIIRPELDITYLRLLVRSALPAFGATIMFFFYFRIDAYMLSVMKGATSTGLYGAAYNFAFGASFLAVFFGRATLARFGASSGRALLAAYTQAFKVTAWLAVGLSMLLVAATPLFLYIYGAAYSGAQVTYVLLIGAQAMFVFSHLNHMLIFGRDRPNTAWLLATLALGVNVIANLVLIPPLGAAGAALAMLTSEALLLAAQAPVLRWVLVVHASEPDRSPIARNEAQPKAA